MANEPQQIEHRSWRFPFGFFAGPVLWGLQILAGYGLATVSCSIANKMPVYGLVGVSGLITLVAAIAAYGAWRDRAGRQRSILMETNEARDTSTFIAVSGFITSLLFFLLILATFIADFFLSTCPLITMPLP